MPGHGPRTSRAFRVAGPIGARTPSHSDHPSGSGALRAAVTVTVVSIRTGAVVSAPRMNGTMGRPWRKIPPAGMCQPAPSQVRFTVSRRSSTVRTSCVGPRFAHTTGTCADWNGASPAPRYRIALNVAVPGTVMRNEAVQVEAARDVSTWDAGAVSTICSVQPDWNADPATVAVSVTESPTVKPDWVAPGPKKVAFSATVGPAATAGAALLRTRHAARLPMKSVIARLRRAISITSEVDATGTQDARTQQVQ